MIQASDLTIADSGGWRLNTLIGLPIGILLLAVGLVSLVLVIRTYRRSRDNFDLFFLGGISLLLAVLPGLLLSITSVWTLDGRYLQWRDVSGTVEQEVESRLIPAGEGMAERYIVTLDGVPFGVDDSRAALLEPGDKVELACHLEWQYAANDGYVCRWGGEQQ
jgi:hypothetical protein